MTRLASLAICLAATVGYAASANAQVHKTDDQLRNDLVHFQETGLDKKVYTIAARNAAITACWVEIKTRYEYHWTWATTSGGDAASKDKNGYFQFEWEYANNFYRFGSNPKWTVYGDQNIQSLANQVAAGMNSEGANAMKLCLARQAKALLGG
jgi:hypothetical protein